MLCGSLCVESTWKKCLGPSPYPPASGDLAGLLQVTMSILVPSPGRPIHHCKGRRRFLRGFPQQGCDDIQLPGPGDHGKSTETHKNQCVHPGWGHAELGGGLTWGSCVN